jgi:hypothetical protein
MFQGCTGVTGFIWGIPANLSFTDTITSCTGLDAADVDDMLTWMDANSPTAGSRTISYQNLTGGVHLNANRSPAALTARNSLIAKGWIFSGTY